MNHTIKTHAATITIAILFCTVSFAQVGIGTVTPNASSQLDITSTTRGLLIPRMTTAQRTAITSPAQGLLVYDTDANSFWYYATTWTELPKSAWSLTGNGGTVDGTHFIGTTDNRPFNIRVNNQKSGRIDATSANTFWGYQAGISTAGSSNTATGYQALYTNIAGSYNTAVGTSALFSNSNGTDNTATGEQALYSNTTGDDNTSVGFQALGLNSSGNYNTSLGSNSLFLNTTGNGNTAIGYSAGVATGNLSNATAIGYNAVVGASNSMALGGTGADAVKVGIGVTTPVSTLHVKGIAKIFDGATTHTGNFYNGTSSGDGIELVSTGTTNAYIGVQSTATFGLHISKSNVSSNNGLAAFFVNGVNVGTITTNGTTTSYNTTSDFRLKENIRISAYGLSTIMKLQVEDYNYILDAKKTLQTGLLAQQLYQVFPQAVYVGGKDPNTNPWMIDYSKLTPLLVKAVQEQQQTIEGLKTQVNNLEKKNEELNQLKKQVEELSQTVKTMMNK